VRGRGARDFVEPDGDAGAAGGSAGGFGERLGWLAGRRRCGHDVRGVAADGRGGLRVRELVGWTSAWRLGARWSLRGGGRFGGSRGVDCGGGLDGRGDRGTAAVSRDKITMRGTSVLVQNSLMRGRDRVPKSCSGEWLQRGHSCCFVMPPRSLLQEWQ